MHFQKTFVQLYVIMVVDTQTIVSSGMYFHQTVEEIQKVKLLRRLMLNSVALMHLKMNLKKLQLVVSVQVGRSEERRVGKECKYVREAYSMRIERVATTSDE